MRKIITILLLVTAALIALLLFPLELAGSTRIAFTTEIKRAPEDVFDYVTTPGNWPRWHPSSLGVSGATDHPLNVGEKVIEDFSVAGRKGRAIWTVTDKDRPKHWVIDGKVEGGGEGVITYTLTPLPEGTQFERVFVYKRPNLLFAALDALSLREQIEAESVEALRRLKFELEKR